MAPRRRDRISKLPVEILDHILGFLPIKDAAKTAVLSSIWRDVWSNLTQLNFDRHFFSYMEKTQRHPSNYFREYAPGYVINKVLLQHNGTIQKFVIYFVDVGVGILTIKSLDQWLLLVTQKGVEEMNIRLQYNIYKLPNYIFSCSTLKRLHLSYVVVQPMKSPCILPNVDLLSFEYVNFDPIEPSHCAIDVPVLESLLFYCCGDIFNFNMTAPKLCDLTITGCYSDCLDKFLPVNLDLRSISTLNLQYSNIEKFVEEISRMGFQLNVERLKLSFTYQTDTITPALVHLLQSCPKLCRLDLNVSALEEMEIRYNRAFSKLLSKLQGVAQTNKMLRTLKLDSFSGWQSEILFIKEVLAYFSALEKLFIIFASYNQTEEFKFGVMQQLLHFPRASTKAEIVVLHFPHAYPTKAEIDVI
ncbi:PREDICTED: F-box/FBD/LRR-repeat protein At1g13570-like isoform X1 [Ipomoea nil]|uniref:F-box/FBD/LRR-repeat protein At1g13570-like isoform X1 n=1 Tax=Ipomoea nil TaxID=35883 RepID=UPI000901224F|nr:PREDICTED: F-box/FBD/LRR-repeat protein At1g13570-like isoform X1 [Ipomoea nil]XP_019161839.1 PREDICTED: F-box/FBD/LRR-repeat protein At1g13570-like isoform X1 [Ipomoea nil]